MQVKNFTNAEKIIQSVELLTERSEEQDWIPTEKVTPANEEIVNELKASGALVLPVGTGSNYLTVNFINNRSITSKELQQLTLLKKQLVSLRLSYSNITNKDLKTLSAFDQLHLLYLDHTQVTDSIASEIASLANLQYLNLVGTNVTDKMLSTLSPLKKLKKIYLYETKVTPGGIENFLLQLPDVKIDTGNYMLPPLPTDTIVYKPKV